MAEEGWGLGEWGLSPWSFGADVTLTLTFAVPATIRSVRVSLSIAPLAMSPLSTGDALNPRTWTLTRGDTGEVIPVYAVTMEDSTTAILLLLTVLGSFHVLHTVSTDTLVDTSGNLISYPRTYTFPGLVVAPAPAVTDPIDLKSLVVPGSDVAASLVIGTGGDYENESGSRLLKKLIVRRLISTPGDWAHMPTYGAGLKTKRPLPSRDLPALAALFEQQIELEPSVDSARVDLSYNPGNGILIVNYRVRTIAGATLTGTFPEQQTVVL